MDVGFISHEKMKELSGELGISLDDAAVTRFDRYAACLVETNKVVNLTRITEPDEIIVKHFIDSLAVCKYCNIENGMKVCDVGTGAGFPGVPLLIAHPDLKMTLMDSTRKKLDFIRAAVGELDLRAEFAPMRAEEAARTDRFREQFDVVTARAVSQLNSLCEYCVPLVKTGGRFVSLKGRISDDEKESGIRAAAKLGARLEENVKYVLPDGSEREMLIFKKTEKTAKNYPRPTAQISKKPL